MRWFNMKCFEKQLGISHADNVLNPYSSFDIRAARVAWLAPDSDSSACFMRKYIDLILPFLCSIGFFSCLWAYGLSLDTMSVQKLWKWSFKNALSAWLYFRGQNWPSHVNSKACTDSSIDVDSTTTRTENLVTASMAWSTITESKKKFSRQITSLNFQLKVD